MSAREAYTEALQEFLDAHAELAEWVRSRVPRYVESEIRILGRDVQSAVDWVWFSESRAIEAVEQLKADPTTEDHLEATRLASTAIKTFYMFLRAYHDTMYRVVVALGGARPGDKATMTNGLQEQNPFRKMIDRRLPPYREEFLAMRKRRRRVKRGEGHSIVANPGPDGGVLLLFSSISDDGMEMKIVAQVSRATIVGDLKLTTGLVRAVTAEYRQP